MLKVVELLHSCVAQYESPDVFHQTPTPTPNPLLLLNQSDQTIYANTPQTAQSIQHTKKDKEQVVYDLPFKNENNKQNSESETKENETNVVVVDDDDDKQ